MAVSRRVRESFMALPNRKVLAMNAVPIMMAMPAGMSMRLVFRMSFKVMDHMVNSVSFFECFYSAFSGNVSAEAAFIVAASRSFINSSLIWSAVGLFTSAAIWPSANTSARSA